MIAAHLASQINDPATNTRWQEHLQLTEKLRTRQPCETSPA